jgi:hypothetical protein
VELVWLTGKLMPDFKTIADFRRTMGTRSAESAQTVQHYLDDLDRADREPFFGTGEKKLKRLCGERLAAGEDGELELSTLARVKTALQGS